MTRHADTNPDEMSRENAEGFYPAPWSISIHPGTNRAAIVDANYLVVLKGMNINKARIIIGAVNRDRRSAHK